MGSALLARCIDEQVSNDAARLASAALAGHVLTLPAMAQAPSKAVNNVHAPCRHPVPVERPGPVIGDRVLGSGYLNCGGDLKIVAAILGRMDEAERQSFLARFAEDGCGVGFAVLGGSFAEGIDLAGTRLIGAFVATLGLPQLNPVNEELRRRLDSAFGSGYDYAYLFPGIRKVVQAAGRVIRTPSDRGVLHLIDDRFAKPEVLRLLPRWWRVETTGT